MRRLDTYKEYAVVNIMIATSTPKLSKAVETGDISHTGVYMASIIMKGIISVSGVVYYTDSTSCGVSDVVT